MRISLIVALTLPLAALFGCQTLGDRINYVQYDGYTGADFATAGDDGSIEVIAIGSPHAALSPDQAAQQIAEAMTGSNFGPQIPFKAQSGAPAADGYQVVVRFGQSQYEGALCDAVGANETVSSAFTAAFCKDGAALSYVSGISAEPGAAFRSTMAIAAIDLFPLENPEFAGCDFAHGC